MKMILALLILSAACGRDGLFVVPEPDAAMDGGMDSHPASDVEIVYCGDGYHRVNYAPPELVYCSPYDGVGRDEGQCGPGFTPVHLVGADPTVVCVPPSDSM